MVIWSTHCTSKSFKENISVCTEALALTNVGINKTPLLTLSPCRLPLLCPGYLQVWQEHSCITRDDSFHHRIFLELVLFILEKKKNPKKPKNKNGQVVPWNHPHKAIRGRGQPNTAEVISLHPHGGWHPTAFASSSSSQALFAHWYLLTNPVF